MTKTNKQIRVGTSHFNSLNAAGRYFKSQGYDDPADAVAAALQEGRIHVGKPKLQPGQQLELDRTEGRYFIVCGG